jgi:peptidoglycan/xylan/chitin deacetylase (PgdA/CDA1 family)
MVVWRRRRAGGRRIAIVSYHRVVPDFDQAVRTAIPGLLVSQRTFRRHLEQAQAAGFDLVSLTDALEVMAGSRTARRDLLVVTFDDGYRDVVRYAAPVLRQMGVPATCYLATGLVGTGRRFDHDRLHHLLRLAVQQKARPEGEPAAALVASAATGSLSAALDQFIAQYSRPALLEALDQLERALAGGELLPADGELMSWDEARQLTRDGLTLGAHTENHAVLTLLDQRRAEEDIRASKQTIERETGQRVLDFAYCNGWYSRELIRLLAAQGFRSAVTTEDWPNRLGGDPFALRRKVLWENFSRGLTGKYSEALTRCQLDDVFGTLRLNHPVAGLRASSGGG